MGLAFQSSRDRGVAVETFVEERTLDKEMGERIVGVPEEEDAIARVG